MAENGNGSGAKAFGGIMAVLAILATVVASLAYFVLPLHGRLEAIEDQRLQDIPMMTATVLNQEKLKELSKDHDTHLLSGGHPTLSERVKALETNNISVRFLQRDLRMLWFKVYGEDMPAVNGGH